MASLDYSLIADLYDAYVTTNLDVPFYIEQARGRHRVLELMAGTGRVSIPLLEAGVPLTCVDSSASMLGRLRVKAAARGLLADVREMDVCALDLGSSFDLIILPFHSFSEIIDAPAQQMALAAIRKHLEPGGRFVCPLHNPPVRGKLIDGVRRVRGEFAFGDNGEKLILSSAETCTTIPGIVQGMQFYDIFDSDTKPQQHREVGLCFYLHTPESFRRLAEGAGFRVTAIYGGYDRGPFKTQESAFMIWVLTL